MSGTKEVRELLHAELKTLEVRRQAIFRALDALDRACDHATYTVSDWGQWSGGYNGMARCDECNNLFSPTRNGELAEVSK